MAARRWLMVVVAVCGALAVTGAVAKGPPPVAQGCTYVQAPYCLGLATAKGTYSLWNANPWIPPGTAVQVWGTPSGQGPCGATSIQVTSWKPGKNKCKA